jgi:hypothetical protein
MGVMEGVVEVVVVSWPLPELDETFAAVDEWDGEELQAARLRAPTAARPTRVSARGRGVTRC